MAPRRDLDADLDDFFWPVFAADPSGGFAVLLVADVEGVGAGDGSAAGGVAAR